jgi:tRNA modification GTPase
MKDITDTICALSTPPGRSGMAVIRMSGPRTLDILRRIFSARQALDPLPHRGAMLGRIVDPKDGVEIDEAVVTCFYGPHSYTGEDLCEFSIHGSPVLITALLDCLCALDARIAEPGEFTMRAFLHGRIDLTQAEAIRDLIDATTLYQAQVAARQRSGSLARQIGPVKELLTGIIADLESTVEFAEQDLPVASRQSIVGQLKATIEKLRAWVESFHSGKIIRDGFSMTIVGRPNVGKSSLFNALLAQNRSIVAEMPGTTRDLISEFTNIGGIPVRLLDTAGIHDTDGFVERLGIDRSREAIADADAILLVGDTSRPRTTEDMCLRKQLEDLRCFVVLSKSDLPSHWSEAERCEFAGAWPCMEVSAKTGAGIAELRAKILQQILGAAGAHQDGMLVTNLRHRRNLEEVEGDLVRAASALESGLSEEFALTDLHCGLRKLGEITGETGVEDLLSEIFSRFCVGK